MKAQRIGELTLGHSVNQLLDYGFDYLLYPVVLWHYGAWLGGGIMALVSLVVCLFMLYFYDWSKRDWLGIEAVKTLRDPGQKTGVRRLLARILLKGQVPAFFALSVYTDPFITIAYMREGAFNGLNHRDWKLFLGSWFIGNLAWILFLSGGIWVIKANIRAYF